jgi:V/A-type H+/Na+-transporting ATPase subunit I
MFFPQAMSEIELIVPSKDLLNVMRVLGSYGVFHQVDGSAAAPTSTADIAGTWQQKASALAAMERRVQAVMQTLEIDAMPPARYEFHDVTDPDAVAPMVDHMEAEVKHKSEALSSARKHLETLQDDRRQLEPIAEIDLDMGALRQSHFAVPILGTMPASNVARLQTSLARVPHLFLIVREDPQKPVVWLAGTRANSDVLERAAKSAYVEPLSLPTGYDGTPASIIGRLDSEIRRTKESISRLEDDLHELAAQHRQALSQLSWEVHSSRTLVDAIGRFGKLRHTYIVLGWVPTDKLDGLTIRLRQVSRETVIESIPASRQGDRQNVPVALQSSRILRPFQMLVTTYARPRYGEIDPTWLIAFTFPLLFGAMFGDVGHGLLLALLGVLLTSGRVPALRSLAGLGGLIAVCGLVATAFGFLYGSIFGFEDILPALWMHPLQNILSILAVAVGAGVLLLSLGFLIGIFNYWVSREWGHLLFGHNGIAGFVLYWSLLGLAGSLAKLIPVPSMVFGVLAIVSGLIIMFSEVLIHLVDGERPLVEGGLATYAIQAPVELFEAVISLLSNSLSYVRVGAFAVAHGGLSSAIFILAALVGPRASIGYWIVVALGNLFIVGFEGLIVGIQTMRLSYYEFFSKFFRGGGMRFEPIVLAPTKDD